MRSIRMLAALTGTLTLASACGDGGTPPTDNVAPVSSFTEVCTLLSCVFTDASTDSDGTITGWSWNFGDGATATVQNPPAHVYAAAGAKTVVLTVTDNEGATNAFTKTVTVTGAPANTAPTASFTLPTDCTAGTPCGFTSTSTDADGTIATTAWNFGDGGTADTPAATHTYTAAGTYAVTLTVTDNLGLASTPATQQLVVSPVASQDCTTAGTTVDCSLTMTQRVTVKITVVSEACELSGNKLEVTAPRLQTAFFNLCNQAPGNEYTVTDAVGAPLVFEAGTPIALRFSQGPQGTNPPVSDPGIQISGSYPNWTLNIDDGGAAGTPGEPDFNDAVLSVQATLAP